MKDSSFRVLCSSFLMRLLYKPSNTMLLTDVKWCNSFLCRLRGLMFRSSLREGEGLLEEDINR